MQTPAFDDFMFVSASLLGEAAQQTTAGVEDLDASLFYPGLVIPPSSSITVVPSSMVVTTTFGNGTRVLFQSGVLAGGYGTTNGALSGVYSNNFAPLVPGSGSVTAYLVASAAQVGQQPVQIPGPTPGHPDYDPTFAPYVAYAETLDTVALTATLTPPDNLTAIEIARTTLTNGQTSISSLDITWRVPVVAIGAAVFATDKGAGNAYAVQASPALTASVPAGLVVNFLPANTNTGLSTFEFANGAANAYIVQGNGGQLRNSQIQVGEMASIAWNGSAWTLLSSAGLVPLATSGVNGATTINGTGSLSRVLNFTPPCNGTVLVTGSGEANLFLPSPPTLTQTGGTTIQETASYFTTEGGGNPGGICIYNGLYSVTAGNPVTITATMTVSGSDATTLSLYYILLPTSP